MYKIKNHFRLRYCGISNSFVTWINDSFWCWKGGVAWELSIPVSQIQAVVQMFEENSEDAIMVSVDDKILKQNHIIIHRRQLAYIKKELTKVI